MTYSDDDLIRPARIAEAINQTIGVFEALNLSLAEAAMVCKATGSAIKEVTSDKASE